jgi:hypothetical protein
MAIHTRLVTYIYLVTYYVRLNLVMLVFVRPNSSYVRPKLKVIGQMSCQVKYLFAALLKGHSVTTRKYMHAETLALLTKPLYYPNMR